MPTPDLRECAESIRSASNDLEAVCVDLQTAGKIDEASELVLLCSSLAFLARQIERHADAQEETNA